MMSESGDSESVKVWNKDMNPVSKYDLREITMNNQHYQEHFSTEPAPVYLYILNSRLMITHSTCGMEYQMCNIYIYKNLQILLQCHIIIYLSIIQPLHFKID